MKILSYFLKRKDKDFEKALSNALRSTEKVRQSLRDYDEGKKDISTAHFEKLFPDIKIRSED